MAIERNLRGASITVGIHSDTGSSNKKYWGLTEVKPDQNKSLLRSAIDSEKKKGAGTKERKKKGIVEDPGIKLIDVALEHEFGVNTPERSFLRAWFDENELTCRKNMEIAAKRAAQSGLVSTELLRMGAWAAGSIKRRIIAGIAPALSARRKSEKAKSGGRHKDTPLIFTGQLLSSIMVRHEK